MKSIKVIAILSLLAFFSGNIIDGGYSIGDNIEDFRLKSVKGEMVSLADYKNAQGFIIIFDCNTCPFSQAYRERIKALHAKYSDQGYPVIAINPNDPTRSPGDSFDKMVNYANDHNYRHEYLYDSDQAIASAFGATNTPQVFIVKKDDKNLKLAYKGAIDNNSRDASAVSKKYVEDAVDSLLKGENPETNKTKAIGCTIKWAES